jgi:hypothetical protein
MRFGSRGGQSIPAGEFHGGVPVGRSHHVDRVAPPFVVVDEPKHRAHLHRAVYFQLMWGESKDVDGECNARLEIGDDFGDNHATMRCQREPGHEGRHREVYKSSRSGEVIVGLVRFEPDVALPLEDLFEPVEDDDADEN